MPKNSETGDEICTFYGLEWIFELFHLTNVLLSCKNLKGFYLDNIGNRIFKPIKTGPKHVMVTFVPLTLGTLGT